MEVVFKEKCDKRGNLIAIDSEFDLPFSIKRVFYIKNMDNLERGFHAHRKCEQVLVAIEGSFTLILDNGEEITEFNLNKSNIGVHIPLYHWLKMKNFSKDCIIMVICSYKYDETEYIRDYDLFLNEINQNKKTNKITTFSLKDQTIFLKNKIMNKIENIIDRNEFVMGSEVKLFEEKFKLYNDSKHCIAVSNGCSALKIALKSLQLNNPRVLIQANTYVAVPLVCEELNIPYDILDIDDNLLLDINKLEDYFESKKDQSFDYIVVIVHLYGNSVNMDNIMALKDKHNFKLVEDAAQAHGSSFNGKKLGTFGDLGCFSFYPSKNLGAFGEGGAIVTDNESYAKFCNYYRNYGSIEKYKWEIIGSNERMHNLQGGVLSIKLEHLDEWNNKRNNLARIYINKLKENAKFKILKPIEGCSSNIHLFIVIVENRDELKRHLEQQLICCEIHYPRPFYETDAYKHVKVNDCMKMDIYKYKLLSLPIYPEFSEENVIFICNTINEFYSN
jgi:dTDP-4-amino-4,6-dideoxygalactose transaminase